MRTILESLRYNLLRTLGIIHRQIVTDSRLREIMKDFQNIYTFQDDRHRAMKLMLKKLDYDEMLDPRVIRLLRLYNAWLGL
jgi:hypothetical protein